MLTVSNDTKFYFEMNQFSISSFLTKRLMPQFYLCTFGPTTIIDAGNHCRASLKLLSTRYASFCNFNLHWCWSRRHPFMQKALQQQMTSIGNQYSWLTFLLTILVCKLVGMHVPVVRV